VRLSGVVRRAARPSNTGPIRLTSDKVADAHISYSGRGVIDSSNRGGLAWHGSSTPGLVRRTKHPCNSKFAAKLCSGPCLPAAADRFRFARSRKRNQGTWRRYRGCERTSLVGYGLGRSGLDSTRRSNQPRPAFHRAVRSTTCWRSWGIHGFPQNVTPQAQERRAAPAPHRRGNMPSCPAFVKARANHRHHRQLHRQTRRSPARGIALGHSPAWPRWTDLLQLRKGKSPS